MSSDITEEMFDVWKNNPVTQAVFETIAEWKVKHLSDFTNNPLREGENNYSNYLIHCGYIQGLEAIMEIQFPGETE